MKFHIFSTLVAISYCSLVSATELTRGLFSSSSNDAPSYNKTSSVDIAKEVDLRFDSDDAEDWAEERGKYISIYSVSFKQCVQPARMQEGAGVELIKCVHSPRYKRRQAWIWRNGIIRHSRFNDRNGEGYRDMCISVKTDEDHISNHELIMRPCGKHTKNREAKFIYSSRTRKFSWAANTKYYITHLGTALYLRKAIPNSSKARGQKWDLTEGFVKKPKKRIFRDRTDNLLSPQPANDTKLTAN